MIYSDMWGNPEPYEGDITWYYDRENNLFIDNDMGYEVINIFDVISPNQLWLFKYKKEDMRFIGRHGEYVELIYPLDDEDEYDWIFYYSPSLDVFTGESGYPITDITDIIDATILQSFKDIRNDMVVVGKNGYNILLEYDECY